MRRRAAAIGLILSAAVAGGGGALAQDMADHAHMHEAPAAAGGTPAAPALYTADDLAFLHHMTMHHQQALEMSALAEGRSERPDFLRFATNVADAQRAEMDMMQQMMDMAVARGMAMPAHAMGGDPPMAGMLSSAEMKALAAARGAEFERLWLEGMIFHHEGGLAMARAQELRQALDGRQPYGLAMMIDDVLMAQRAEITQMHKWLGGWGLSDGQDRRSPGVEVASPAPATTLPVGRPTTVFGVAVDDRAIGAVQVGVQDVTRDRWLHGDGSWGDRQLQPAERVASGPASTAWSFAFTPPSPGRYAIVAEAQDESGRSGKMREPATFEAR